MCVCDTEEEGMRSEKGLYIKKKWSTQIRLQKYKQSTVVKYINESKSIIPNNKQ